MIRTQIRLGQHQHELAKSQAAKQGISLAEFFRRAIRDVLPVNAEKPWMRYAGFVESGDSRSSRSIDEVLYSRRH